MFCCFGFKSRVRKQERNGIRGIQVCIFCGLGFLGVFSLSSNVECKIVCWMSFFVMKNGKYSNYPDSSRISQQKHFPSFRDQKMEPWA